MSEMFLIFVKQQWYCQQYGQSRFLFFEKQWYYCQQYDQSCSWFFDKEQYYCQQYDQNCSRFLLSNNSIVNNAVKAYVKFNTNLLHDDFYLLINALTCFGLTVGHLQGGFIGTCSRNISEHQLANESDVQQVSVKFYICNMVARKMLQH